MSCNEYGTTIYFVKSCNLCLKGYLAFVILQFNGSTLDCLDLKNVNAFLRGLKLPFLLIQMPPIKALTQRQFCQIKDQV